MANTSNIRGFVPVRYLNGVEWNGQFNIYYHSAGDPTPIGVGDPVAPAWSADPTGRFPAVRRAAVGEPVQGVAIGFATVPSGIQGVAPAVLFDATNLTKVYGAASTEFYVAVVDDPFVVFEVQEDSDTSNIGVGGVMGTVVMVVADCDTTSGYSQFTIDSSGATGSQEGYGWRILGLVDRPDNAIGQYAKWFVLCNNHIFMRAQMETVASRSNSPSASPSTSPS